MSVSCRSSSCSSTTTVSPRYRKVFWMALIINVATFAVEIVGGLNSGSVSLLANVIDFAGDAANYGISLAVLSMDVAIMALVANGGVALMLLYAFRDGDANMRSVWLFSRNDAIGDVAVVLAAVGVFGTGSNWLDLLVALLMGGLALSSGVSVIRHAHHELVPLHSAIRAGGAP